MSKWQYGVFIGGGVDDDYTVIMKLRQTLRKLGMYPLKLDRVYFNGCPMKTLGEVTFVNSPSDPLADPWGKK